MEYFLVIYVIIFLWIITAVVDIYLNVKVCTKGEKVMRVKFIQNVQLSDGTIIREGDVFQAREEEDFIMIRLPNDRTVKAPKNEIEGVLEILMGNLNE